MGPKTLMSASDDAATDAVQVAPLGDDAEAGLVSEDAAEAGRDAHRTSDIGAELEARETGRYRRGRRRPRSRPGVRVRSQGLLVVPNRSLKVWTSPDHSGTLVLPKTTAPAWRSRATAGASTSGT